MTRTNASPPPGTVTRTFLFAVVGTLAVAADQAPTIIVDGTFTIVKVKAVVKTAPTGTTLIADVNRERGAGGQVTIFTTQANRPTIPIAGFEADSGTPDVTSLIENDKLTVDIDQIGSVVAGEDLTIEVVCTQTVSS